MLFDLIEGIRGELGDEAAGSDEEGRGHEGEGPGSDLDEEAWREEAFVPPAEEDQRGGGEPPDWALSEVVAEKKSVFVARAARVRSVEEVKRNLAHLVETDKKVARATHNILGMALFFNGYPPPPHIMFCTLLISIQRIASPFPPAR